MKKPILHVLGVPSTITTNKKYLNCAFTQKIFKFIRMMKLFNYEIFHYGHEESEIDCENITVISSDFFNKEHKNSHLSDNFTENANPYPATTELYQEYYKNTVDQLSKYISVGDIICYTYNAYIFPDIMKKIKSIYGNDIFHVETGIGYFNTYADFRAFESYHCHSYVMGYTHSGKNIKRPFGGVGAGAPSFSDWIIPNYFEESNFEYNPEKKEDYFVYLGRMHRYTKGTDIAIQVAEKCDLSLILAGPDEPNGYFKKTKLPNKVEYIGSVGLEERKKLLSNAKGMFMPSLFPEPFGGSGVESLLSGTPVISTDHSVFNEWNLHGYTGYRCRTFSEFCWAANNIDSIDNEFCYNWAKGRYTLPVVGKKFDRMFTYIRNIYNGDGFYEDEELENLDYLNFFEGDENFVYV